MQFPTRQSFLKNSQALANTVLFRVPNDADRDYIVSLYVVDRGGNAPSAILIWNDGSGSQEAIVTSPGTSPSFAVHAAAGSSITLTSQLGKGTKTDYDIYVSFLDLN